MNEISITQAVVSIQAVRVGAKQMTQAVFNQILPLADIPSGKVLGWVKPPNEHEIYYLIAIDNTLRKVSNERISRKPKDTYEEAREHARNWQNYNLPKEDYDEWVRHYQEQIVWLQDAKQLFIAV